MLILIYKKYICNYETFLLKSSLLCIFESISISIVKLTVIRKKIIIVTDIRLMYLIFPNFKFHY